jgi:hypothetical protein
VFDGAKGDQGIQGEQGIQGIQGLQGLQGIDGSMGEQGIQGEKGEQGDRGATEVQIAKPLSMIAAMATVNSDGTVIQGYNVESCVSDNGTTRYTLEFPFDYSATNYVTEVTVLGGWGMAKVSDDDLGNMVVEIRSQYATSELQPSCPKFDGFSVVVFELPPVITH